MGKLDGKIALITGGSDGIGFATAQQFIKEGATHVYITGRRQDALNKAVKKLDSKKVTAVQGDASNLADLDKLFNLIKKEKGHLDILFANAGVYDLAPLGSITLTLKIICSTLMLKECYSLFKKHYQYLPMVDQSS
jgi:NAD(P)-dependent dehydrogenase (short-subunit alcohol dehydrogenase family)